MNNYIELYNNLNEEQRSAVDHTEGPVLVIAGPGTGKTQLLSMRVANILQKSDTLPQNILCLTFTDSASYNMRTRLRSIIGLDAEKVTISTFHGLGSEIINANPEYFYKGADFQAADELTKLEIIQFILQGLDSDNPLISYHPDQGWIYAKSLIGRIGDLKKSGLTPLEYNEVLDLNWLFIDSIDPLFVELFNMNIKSIKAKHVAELIDKVDEINQEIISKTRVLEEPSPKNIVVNGISSTFQLWGTVFLAELEVALQEAEQGDKFSTKPMTAFRNKWSKKDIKNNTHLKDYIDHNKHKSTAQVYENYQDQMYHKGLFDFDDMLLDVIKALRKFPELRYTYQERFQYILIDEFQDTNGAQMTMAQSFINTEVTNNRPNILVVGDDDQSIFKFQGANIQNILTFKELYDDVCIITLNQNYRSSQDILDLATEVISQSETRLAYEDGITKELISNVSYVD